MFDAGSLCANAVINTMDLSVQFRHNWAARQFCNPAESVLLTVSGGIDSMVMADLFLKNNINFGVAHCNFQLRGAEADADEQLVKDWCELYNIPFHNIRFETKKHSEEWKKGTQETARILRYEWFEQLRKEHKYAKIATAHHGNDNVETLLINLFKGTGIAGMHGILPEQNNIIRPLLFTNKADIQAYAEKVDIYYREDASNASDDYLRNAVRRNIIPAVLEWFPNAIASVNESIERFGEAEQLYRRALETEKKKLIEQRGQDQYIPILKLKHKQPLATIVYEIIHPYGFNSAQVPHVLGLLQSESGHYVNSNSHRIIKNRDFLIITTLPTTSTDLILVEAAPCTIDTGKDHFSFAIEDKPRQLDKDAHTALIDLTKVEFPLILRKWKVGDYMYPLGMSMKKKKVSKLLIEAKMPIHEKEHVWVLECNKRIVWLTGMRLDERFKVRESSEKVLVVTKTGR